jgi:UDP-GlcNAc:undecaprenyl-phosphate/decaprenyl-phosphate GlcNAc-1-phosphate transferase
VKYFIFFSIVNFTIFFFFREKISKKLNLIDKPDNILKIHKYSVPLLGGIILLTNSFLLLCFSIIEDNNYYSKIILLSFFIGLFGLIDDIKNIKPNNKIIFLTFFLVFFFYVFPDMKINSLKFLTFGLRQINLENNYLLSLFFTIICYLLLINAYNMCDGLDGIALFIGIVWLCYFFLKLTEINYYIISVTISLMLIYYFNIRSKIFLGDSGNYYISTFVGSILIKENNILTNYIVEEIFIIFMLPGIDMFRLFIVRIYKKKNPFIGDRNHFHHLLTNKFNKIKSIIIYYLFILIPIIVFKLNIMNPIYVILITIFIYIYFLKILTK